MEGHICRGYCICNVVQIIMFVFVALNNVCIHVLIKLSKLERITLCSNFLRNKHFGLLVFIKNTRMNNVEGNNKEDHLCVKKNRQEYINRVALL